MDTIPEALSVQLQPLLEFHVRQNTEGSSLVAELHRRSARCEWHSTVSRLARTDSLSNGGIPFRLQQKEVCGYCEVRL